MTQTEEKSLVLYDYGEDKGKGFDNLNAGDFRVPLMLVLQSQSKATIEGETLYIPGARPGQFHNNVTNETYDGKQGMLLVACYRTVTYIERKNDGARTFVGKHSETSPMVLKALAANGGTDFGLKTPEGNNLVKNFELYCLRLEGDDVATAVPAKPFVLPFASKKIKSYQTLISRLDGIAGDPPLYAFALRATTYPDKNDKGNFYNVKIEPVTGEPKTSMLAPTSTIFQAAKGFAKLVTAGKAKAADPTTGDPEEETAF